MEPWSLRQIFGKLFKSPSSPYVTSDHHTGIVTHEKWYHDNTQYRATGVILREEWRCICEEWCRNHKLHRDDGPARIERDPKTGIVTSELWYRDGERIDPPARPGPTMVHRDPPGIATLEFWLRDGNRHRDDGPALIRRHGVTGATILEEWYRNNKRHRDGAPAVVERDPSTGAVLAEAWYCDGKRHRDGAPAVVGRDAATGVVTLEIWFRDDKRHRDDGPAETRRDPRTGAVTWEERWLDGKRPEDDKFFYYCANGTDRFRHSPWDCFKPTETPSSSGTPSSLNARKWRP